MIDPQAQQFIEILNNPYYIPLILALMVWSLVWKGFALWKAAGNGQLKWFIALLIVNSAGIIEIVYIFFFSKKRENMQNKPF